MASQGILVHPLYNAILLGDSNPLLWIIDAGHTAEKPPHGVSPGTGVYALGEGHKVSFREPLPDSDSMGSQPWDGFVGDEKFF